MIRVETRHKALVRGGGASLILGYSASIPFTHSAEIEKGAKERGRFEFRILAQLFVSFEPRRAEKYSGSGTMRCTLEPKYKNGSTAPFQPRRQRAFRLQLLQSGPRGMHLNIEYLLYLGCRRRGNRICRNMINALS